MQPLPFIFNQQDIYFIQQNVFANPQAPAAHFCFRSAAQLLQTDFRKSVFRKSGKPRIAPTNLPREDHYMPESCRMKCVGKTCCATYI
jgi:hypothetical protein